MIVEVQVGDSVRFRTGGPVMTVVEISEDNRYCRCKNDVVDCSVPTVSVRKIPGKDDK